MPAPTILFYTPTPQPYAPKLLSFCAVQGFKLRVLENSDLERTLRFLAQGMRAEGPLPEGEALPEPLLVFCHLSQGQLDRALKGLRKHQIACLKAVLTPTNAAWSLRELYGELVKERAQMGGVHSPKD